jgi:hypothetical protein
MAYEMVRLLNSDHPYRYDGTLFGGTKLWTPRELTTALWLDADSPSSITLNGATVSQWNDKSGNARNFSQSTAANQPGYSAPNITFADGSDVLTIGSSGSGTFGYGTNDFAILAVVNPNARTSSWGSEILAQHLFSSRADFSFRILPAGNLEYGGSNAATIATSSTTVPLNQRSIAEVARTSNNFQLYINASSVASNSSSDSIGNLTGSSVGNTFIGNSSAFFSGSINEILVVPTTLSTQNRQLIEGYLAWKWGTQASLPVPHPYYSAPPLV